MNIWWINLHIFNRYKECEHKNGLLEQANVACLREPRNEIVYEMKWFWTKQSYNYIANQMEI